MKLLSNNTSYKTLLVLHIFAAFALMASQSLGKTTNISQRLTEVANQSQEPNGSESKEVMYMAPARTADPSLSNLAASFNQTLHQAISETKRFQMMAAPSNESDKEKDVAVWDMAHRNWSKERFPQLNGVDILAVPTLTREDEYIVATLTTYDLKTKGRPIEINSFRTINMATGSTSLPCYRLAEKIRSANPIFAQIIANGFDGDMIIDKGQTSGVRLGDLFRDRGRPVSDQNGRILTHSSKGLKFRVVKVEPKIAKVEFLGPPEKEIELGLRLMSISRDGKYKSHNNTIRIRPFRNCTGKEENDLYAKVLPDTLLTELSAMGANSGMTLLLGEEDLKQYVLAEHRLNAGRGFDPSTVVKQDRLIGAREWKITGEIIPLKEGIRLTITLFKPDTGEIHSGFALDRSNPAELINAMGEAAKTIRKIVAPWAADNTKANETAKQLVHANASVLTMVPTGILHVLNHAKRKGGGELALVSYAIENRGKEVKRIRISTDVPGWCTKKVEIVDGLGGEKYRKIVNHTPLLKHEKKKALVKTQTVQVDMTVEEELPDGTWYPILAQSQQVTFLPIDRMCWKLPTTLSDDMEVTVPMGLVAAWVAPDFKGAGKVLEKAHKNHPKVKFVGYCGSAEGTLASAEKSAHSVEAQAKAIVETLVKDYDMKYVSQLTGDTLAVGEGQRILLPEQALSLRSSNCIDGVVLMASLLRRIGIDPLIIIEPGQHAYLGWWNLSKVDREIMLHKNGSLPKDSIAFLETTLINENDKANKKGPEMSPEGANANSISGFTVARKRGSEKAKRHNICWLLDADADGIEYRSQLFVNGVTILEGTYILDVKTLKEKRRIGEISS
jgi:hypothetical protein